MKSLSREVHTLEAPTAPGAEKLTLIEQLIDRLRLPYPAGCLVLAVMTGFLGALLSNLADTLDFNRAVEGVLSPYSQRATWSGVLDITVNTAIIFYMLIMIRYLRQKLVEMEPELIGLTPEGAKILRKVFGLSQILAANSHLPSFC